MKRIALFCMALFCSLVLFAQNTTYSNANKVTNGNFSNSLSPDWTSTGSWSIPSGRAYTNANGTLSQALTNIAVVGGVILP